MKGFKVLFILGLISLTITGCKSSSSESSSDSKDKLSWLYESRINSIGPQLLKTYYNDVGHFSMWYYGQAASYNELDNDLKDFSDESTFLNNYSSSCVYKEESYLTDNEDYYVKVVYKYTSKDSRLNSLFLPAFIQINKTSQETSFNYPNLVYYKGINSKLSALEWFDERGY
ncbi:MAG: hypothetical protein IKZ50_05165 [Bacteroidales bacterium]|nr:hypothetical protein [Bacteroidales bacterium]